jgi:hypothetical protein
MVFYAAPHWRSLALSGAEEDFRAFHAKKFHLDGFDALGRDEAETRMRHAGI